ncbi:unnamed protein product [Protopolystoma xenopodis]|uniref:Uncharacterized protein n=1 Tax=Protopolystoma xenopodis TaxID=117903 RepID=A0A448XRV7_9PLAT|nr:unnamed protein product [Protopolystoma xenopodis]
MERDRVELPLLEPGSSGLTADDRPSGPEPEPVPGPEERKSKRPVARPCEARGPLKSGFWPVGEAAWALVWTDFALAAELTGWRV